jgi:hypothetical protein
MKVLNSIQNAPVTDALRAKFAMAAPVLEATLHSLPRARIGRLGGLDKLSLADLAMALKEGDGDAGICFEYAVHDAVARGDKLIAPLASEVLEDFCGIAESASSILFGPEKNGMIPILESTTKSLTDDSRIYVGNAGQPPKLKKYIPQIVRAFRRHEDRNKLPRSIGGLWKADLFLGGAATQKWVGTTVKINPEQLEGAQGLRIGIYPKRNEKDSPRKDEALNLVRLPLPYDGAFMEVYYKSFFLIRAFLQADARVPPPVKLPDAEDRLLTEQLASRRDFPVLGVTDWLRDMSQAGLLQNDPVTMLSAEASLSEKQGLSRDGTPTENESVSLTPRPAAAD